MHEIGIASSILEAVEAEAQRRPQAVFLAVGVRVGELSNVDRDALDFAFSALTRNTLLAHVKLEIEWCPRRERCLGCDTVFAVENYNVKCPVCGGEHTSCAGGTELDIAYLEVEEPCVKL
jgi:hydrogenase nickel incorporation protein HypA/HybF